jgi:hypothetical protein
MHIVLGDLSSNRTGESEQAQLQIISVVRQSRRCYTWQGLKFESGTGGVLLDSVGEAIMNTESSMTETEHERKRRI